MCGQTNTANLRPTSPQVVSTSVNTPARSPGSPAPVCSGLPTRLVDQSRAQVVPGTGPGHIRAGIESSIDWLEIVEGDFVTILQGPECGPSQLNQTWYRVSYANVTGWMSEGNQSTYWLEPVD